MIINDNVKKTIKIKEKQIHLFKIKKGLTVKK